MKKFLVFLVIMWCGVVYGQISPVFIDPISPQELDPVIDGKIKFANFSVGSEFFNNGIIDISGEEFLKVKLFDDSDIDFKKNFYTERGNHKTWMGTVEDTAFPQAHFIVDSITGSFWGQVEIDRYVYYISYDGNSYKMYQVDKTLLEPDGSFRTL
jgi:hypothetical protein